MFDWRFLLITIFIHKSVHDEPGVLLCASWNKNPQLSIFNFKQYSKPKIREINCEDDILVASDYNGDNIAVLEKLNNKMNIYTAEGTLKSSLNGNFNFNCMVLYGSDCLLTGENHGKIRVYDLKNNLTRKLFDTNYPITVDLIDVSIDNKNIFVCYADGKVSKLEIKTARVDNLTWISEKIKCLKISPWVANNLLVGSVNGSVSLYDANNHSRVFTSNTHKGMVNCVSYSYFNDKIAISGGEDKQAILYGINESRPLKTYKTISPVTHCSISDGVLFSFGEANGDISIYDIRKLNKFVYFHKLNDRISYLQFTYKSHQNGDSIEYLSTIEQSGGYANKLSYDCSLESCFSEGEYSVHYNNNHQISCDGFNISHINQRKSSLSPVSNEFKLSNENKLRKQVQFETPVNNNPSVPIDPVAKPESIIESNIQSGGFDKEFLRQTIHEELNKQLMELEDRLSSDILMKTIDQLFITENNIIQSILPVVTETRELLKENKSLCEKLNRHNFF